MYTSLVAILLLAVSASNLGETEAALQAVDAVQHVDQLLFQGLNRHKHDGGKKGKHGKKGKYGKNDGGIDWESLLGTAALAAAAGAGGLAAGSLAAVVASTLFDAITSLISGTVPDIGALLGDLLALAGGSVDALFTALQEAAAAALAG